MLFTYVDKSKIHRPLTKQEDFDLKYELKLEIQCFNYAQNNFLHFYSNFRNQTKPKLLRKQTKLTVLLFH